jgi:3-methyladenine DNA glycosylase AlkC
MTQRFTAEFAIRPFIVQHPALVFDTLAALDATPAPMCAAWSAKAAARACPGACS